MPFLFLLLLAVVAGAHAETEARGAIDWGGCPPSAGAASAAAMDCGWLTTGERLDGEAVRLRVVVLRASPDRHDPDPIIFLPGGPGDSAGLGAHRLARWRKWQQQAGWPHDVVLFDPRGTGESRPRFQCDKARIVPYRRQPDRASSGSFTAQGQAMRRCLRRLGPTVIEQLGPAAQLRDLAALANALGAKRVTLWAISYGTRIAQLFAHRHTGRVAQLILDSLVPFDRNELLALPRQIDSAVARLQARCSARTARCASRNPRAALTTLLARYADAPAQVSLVAYPGLSGRFEVTPYRLLIMLLLASYDTDNEADIAQRLERALRGDSVALAPLAARMASLDRAADRSDAVFWSTRCALAGAQRDDEWSAMLARTPMIAPYLVGARQASACGDWAAPRTPVPARDAALSVPVLVVAGLDDVITPARWARRFIGRHPRARGAWIADGAHASTLSNDCAQRAVAQFVAEPNTPLPSCAEGRPGQSGR